MQVRCFYLYTYNESGELFLLVNGIITNFTIESFVSKKRNMIMRNHNDYSYQFLEYSF